MAEIKSTTKKYDITVRVVETKTYEEDRYKNRPPDERTETAAITIVAASAEDALTKLGTIIPAL